MLKDEFSDVLKRADTVVFLSNSFGELFNNAVRSRANVQTFNEEIIINYKKLSTKFLEGLNEKSSSKFLIIDCDDYNGNDTFGFEERPIIQEIINSIQTHQKTSTISVKDALDRVRKDTIMKKNEEVSFAAKMSTNYTNQVDNVRQNIRDAFQKQANYFIQNKLDEMLSTDDHILRNAVRSLCRFIKTTR